MSGRSDAEKSRNIAAGAAARLKSATKTSPPRLRNNPKRSGVAGIKPHTSTSGLSLIYNLYVWFPPKGRIDWEVTVEKVIHHKPLFSSPLQKPDVSVCSQRLHSVSISAAAAAAARRSG